MWTPFPLIINILWMIRNEMTWWTFFYCNWINKFFLQTSYLHHIIYFVDLDDQNYILYKKKRWDSNIDNWMNEEILMSIKHLFENIEYLHKVIKRKKQNLILNPLYIELIGQHLGKWLIASWASLAWSIIINRKGMAITV